MPGTKINSLTGPVLQGQSVFVTGGTGFVGSHFVERLLSLGCTDVRCLVRRDSRFLGDLPVLRIKGDLFQREALEDGVRDVDYVVHIAALTRSVQWSEFRKANVDGTVELLRAVGSDNPSLKKILVTSSLAVIGTGASPVADESAPLLPVSMYGQSKKEMEEAVIPFRDKLPIVVIRPPAVYGPRESDILTFFKTINNGFCPMIGLGREPAISLVHVDDLVTGMLGAMLSDNAIGNTYFVGSADHYSWREIRDASATALGRRVLTVPIPPMLVTPIGALSELYGKLTGTYPPLNREKAAEIKNACAMCDSSKAYADFGYDPETDLWNGIADTIAWYRRERWLH